MSSPTEKKTVKRTAAFRHWHEALKDQVTRAIVAARIERLQMGLYGDVKPVGDGVAELRIDHGPGFRVYFTETLDRCIILLLVGGDKATQKRDINHAKTMLMALKQDRDASLQTEARVSPMRRSKP